MRTTKKTALAAMAAFTALTLAACDGSSSDDGKKTGASAKPDKSAAAKTDDLKSETLKAGQPASEEQEFGNDKKGKFTVTGQRIVMGKPEDLKGGKEDEKKYAGKTVAYVYLSARLSGGDAPMKPPMMITNVGALTEGDQPATRLMVIGSLPSTPSDCKDEDYTKTWNKGEERTFCQPVVVPQNQKVTRITFRRGFYKEPLKWALEK
ncbi:hypothetical protein I5Q34_22800 [Streptomyces sp. AV19]|uniref:hypothetical protein n=1 Tax=Streptomyces sp. AV19 TaxID=2793068 RepID=UPI0018FEBADC|nr:hypothetical protein [Streptomyces sp. AV19]MBH1937061.1 hypothetical protein [Streptomyces sp. AV19]MDG4535900.1 hypothetical protein [Streptomyces sp. AV19]